MPIPTLTRGGAFITPGYRIGFMLVVSLFFLWAIANNFNDILIRQFQKALDLNRAQAGFIQFVFYIGYFVMALPAGLLMRRFGYKAGDPRRPGAVRGGGAAVLSGRASCATMPRSSPRCS